MREESVMKVSRDAPSGHPFAPRASVLLLHCSQTKAATTASAAATHAATPLAAPVTPLLPAVAPLAAPAVSQLTATDRDIIMLNSSPMQWGAPAKPSQARPAGASASGSSQGPASESPFFSPCWPDSQNATPSWWA